MRSPGAVFRRYCPYASSISTTEPRKYLIEDLANPLARQATTLRYLSQGKGTTAPDSEPKLHDLPFSLLERAHEGVRELFRFLLLADLSRLAHPVVSDQVSDAHLSPSTTR